MKNHYSDARHYPLDMKHYRFDRTTDRHSAIYSEEDGLDVPVFVMAIIVFGFSLLVAWMVLV